MDVAGSETLTDWPKELQVLLLFCFTAHAWQVRVRAPIVRGAPLRVAHPTGGLGRQIFNSFTLFKLLVAYGNVMGPVSAYKEEVQVCGCGCGVVVWVCGCPVVCGWGVTHAQEGGERGGGVP